MPPPPLPLSPSSRRAADANEPCLRNRGESNRAVKFKAKLPLHKGHPELSETFWSNLALFTTGIITQSVDVRELHRHRIKSKSSGNTDPSLSQQVRLPSIEISLADLFPSMASPRDKTAAADDSDLFSLMQKHTGTATLKPKQAWADEVVLVNFKGIRSLSATPEEADADGSPPSKLICASDAVIKVRRPATFAALKGMVDRDVSYNPGRGEFSLRILRPVGSPILDALKPRIKAIDRFVNFYEAVASAGGAVTTELMTLSRVTFCYGARPGPGGQGVETSKPWRVSLNLSKDEIKVEMDRGNPHLRVLDLMKRLVNSDGGIGALITWLPASLPALAAVDELQTRWDSVEAQNQGRLEFAMNAIGWMRIKYSGAAPGGIEERVVLELRMKLRQGGAWWHVWRCDAGAGASPPDEFTKALKPVWSAKGQGWLGLTTGAASRPGHGVEAMLLAINDALRRVVVGTGGGSSPPLKGPRQGGSHDVVVLD